jgi:hypothetical protein
MGEAKTEPAAFHRFESCAHFGTVATPIQSLVHVRSDRQLERE